jgi:lysophospholipase L1-like esterase
MTEINTALLPVRDFEVGDNALSYDALGNVVRSLTKPSESFDSLTSAVAFVTANPAAIERLSTDSNRNEAECLALSIDYPDEGGGDYTVSSTSGAVDDYNITAAGVSYLYLVGTEAENIRKAGAYGTPDDTNKIQKVINSALLSNKVVDVNLEPLQINEAIEGFSNVVTKGNQNPVDFQGLHTFRRTPDNNMKGSLTVQAMDFQYLLPVYSALNSAKICFVGDSLMTYGADSLTTQDTLAVLLQHKFTVESKKTLTFVNRAIAGQTWTGFNNLPSSFPSWYTDQSRDWYNYVVDENPDVVVFGFGMNDTSSFNAPDLINAVAQITASGAEVMFVTNLVPTLEPSATYDSFGTRDAQNGRDFVANWVRSYARENKFALLDMHDYYCQVRDGFCPAVSAFERRLTDGPIIGGNYFQGDVTTFSPGYSFELLLTGTDLVNKVYINDKIKIPLGSYFNNIAVIEASGTGTFLVRLYEWGGVQTSSYDTGVAIPSGDHKLFISVSDNMFTFKPIFRGSTDAPVMLPFVGVGGEFRPEVETVNASHTAFSTITLDVAVSLKVNKGAFNDTIWGVSNADALIKMPYGGNGINHPTTKGVALIYKQFLKQFYFR